MKIYFFFIFLGVFLNAQTITGKVLSQYDNSPIPYAKIGIGNEENGTVADENGNYILDLSNVNKDLELNVDLGGFEKFAISINSFLQKSNHNILLKEKVRDIEEVVIKPKHFKDKHWGVDSKSKRVVFDIYPDHKKEKEEQSRELAIKISNNKKVKIQKVNLNIADFQAKIPAKIRINIYTEKEGKPYQSVLYEDITGVISKDSIENNTFSIDVSNENIYVNSNFFVSVQFVNYFKGYIYISGELFGKGFERKYYGNWEKVSLASPAINVDVKVER